MQDHSSENSFLKGNTDTVQNQFCNLSVQDAVMKSFQEELENLRNTELAKQYLQEKLPLVQKTFSDTLAVLGNPQETAVSLCREWFDTQRYDAFSLSDFIYKTLHAAAENTEEAS